MLGLRTVQIESISMPGDGIMVCGVLMLNCFIAVKVLKGSQNAENISNSQKRFLCQ